jgi:hypothetical protein
MPGEVEAAKITNPRRILAVSLEQEANHLSRILKGERGRGRKRGRLWPPDEALGMDVYSRIHLSSLHFDLWIHEGRLVLN